MLVERYSFDAFRPQKQTHHLENVVNFHLNKFDKWLKEEKIEQLYPHLYRNIIEKHELLVPFYKENYNDFTEGVWVFWKGYKNNQSLNHLKHKVPCFEAWLPDDIEVYDVNLEKKMLLSDIEVSYFGCFVPARSLKDIKNIHPTNKI